MEQKQLYKIQFSKQYKLYKKLKMGAFGTVYLAQNKQQKQFAIKISKGQNAQTLTIEKQIYKALQTLQPVQGFIKYYDAGNQSGYEYIVMELIGSDLQDLYQKTTIKKFSIKTTIMIGLQLIQRLKILHSLGFLHRDIKPDNLAIGVNQNNAVIYLLDFGLGKKIVNKSNEPQKTGNVVGTYRFMSINSHNGIQLSKRDDIETIAYLLMFFIEGKLPWQNIRLDAKQNFQKLKKMKQNVNKKQFSKDVPEQIFELLDYSRKLKFNENPDYDFLTKLLKKSLDARKIKNDLKFDWIKEDPYDKSRSKSNRKKQSNQNSKQKKIQLKKMLETKRSKEKQKLDPIDKEILAVFKFCNTVDDFSRIENIQQKRQQQQKNTIIKPIEIKNEPKISSIKRPVSAKKQPQNQQNTQLIKMMNKLKNQKFQHPKIVINKEAKFKV